MVKAKSSSTQQSESNDFPVCEVPEVPVRQFDPSLDPGRLELIRNIEKKWVNGTVLRYHFLDKPKTWRGPKSQKQAVRDAFAAWKQLGLGIEFSEVATAAAAEIRIGFESGGSWSYVGRDALRETDPSKRTMNFGWDLLTPYGRDTALHEIGHALGFPHEHQNPNAGIVWDEPAVIKHFAGPPNRWQESKTRYNILRKLDPARHEGSDWDRDSIMHYRFAAGLILEPARYRKTPLVPAGGLSSDDIAQAQRFYPALAPSMPMLVPFESQRLLIAPGEQLNFVIKPELSRTYTIQTFGRLDTVMVLFEEINGVPTFYAGDDDSGTDLNACIRARLLCERDYVLRLRLYCAQSHGEGALMTS